MIGKAFTIAATLFVCGVIFLAVYYAAAVLITVFL
jgi:hypothetical protein